MAFGSTQAEGVGTVGEQQDEQAEVASSRFSSKILLNFDQLALESPKGRDTVLLFGPQEGQEVY